MYPNTPTRAFCPRQLHSVIQAHRPHTYGGISNISWDFHRCLVHYRYIAAFVSAFMTRSRKPDTSSNTITTQDSTFISESGFFSDAAVSVYPASGSHTSADSSSRCDDSSGDSRLLGTSNYFCMFFPIRPTAPPINSPIFPLPSASMSSIVETLASATTVPLWLHPRRVPSQRAQHCLRMAKIRCGC